MDYQLLPHEYMVMHDDHVRFGNSSSSTDDLILTNLHLILVKKGFFGGKKGEIKIPINQIKVFEGKPQVLVNKVNGLRRLEIYYTGGQASFGFNNAKDTDKWANNIIKLMAGDTDNFEKIGDNGLWGVDVLAGTLKETFDTFKTGLGFKEAGPQKVSVKWSFCGAPLLGQSKQTVKCSYCDMEQTL